MSVTKLKNYIEEQNGVTMFLYGEIDEWWISADSVVRELSELERSYENITIRINSVGGSVFEGIAIYNAIRNSRANIKIMVDGIAASMASVIALCGKPVYMSKYAQLMMHCVSGGAYGNTKEVEKALANMKEFEKIIVKMYAEKTGLTEDEISLMWMDGDDHWFTAQEAYNMHLIDGIYDGDNLGTQDTMSIYKKITNKYVNLIHNNQMINKLKMISAFSALSTEDEFLNEIRKMAEQCEGIDALKAKAEEADKFKELVEELQKKISDIEASATAQKIEDMLGCAVQEHKINQAVAEQLKKSYANNVDGLKTLLDAMQSKKKVEIEEPTNGDDSILKMSWDELDKAEKLSELKAKYPETFKAKYAEKFGK